MKPKINPYTNRVMTPSLRVQHDIYTEQEYLEEHPELDNVFTFHQWKSLPRSALYFDRFGKFALCLPCIKERGCWRLLKYNDRRAVTDHHKNKYYRAYYNIKKDKYRAVSVFVHHIIAELFVNCDNIFATQLDHLDGISHNNRYDNLEYVTHEENYRRRTYNYYTRQGRPVPAKYLQYY